MAEYRIVASLDPSQVTAGSAKVKQELQGVDTVADSTKRHLQGTFQAPELVAALGSLTTRITSVEGSLDRVAAASLRAGSAQDKAGASSRGAAQGQSTLEAATRRVLQAVDQEAAELMRLNGLLNEAKRLHDAGAITGQQYARVQNLVATSTAGAVTQTGAQRAGYQQLGFQLNDVVASLASGANPMMVFAQQASQLGQALTLISGGGGRGGATAAAQSIGNLQEQAEGVAGTFDQAKSSADVLTAALGRDAAAHTAVAGSATTDARATGGSTVAHAENAVAANAEATALGRSTAGNLADGAAADANAVSHGLLARAKMAAVGFLAGPWSAAVIAGTVVLGTLASKLFETKENVEDLTKKMAEDAKQAALTREAQAAFGNTLDGVTEALRRNRDALKALEEEGKTAARRALEQALQQEIRLKGIRAETAALLEQAKAARENNLQILGGVATPEGKDFAAQNLSAKEDRIAEIEKNLAKTDADIAEAARQREEALSRRVVERQDMDAVEKIRERYDGRNGLIDMARRRALAEGTVATTLAAQVRHLQALRDAEVKIAQDAERRKRPTSDGVDRFRTRQQAIGIAGRELQQGGLRVSENEQFGGVKANHPGMGNDAHGKFAVDVNVGKGITEANVPDLKSRFDELARRYQARGYEVVWNGQFYAAGGDGPTRRAAGHSDHLHIQAPRTIVGMATQSSTEAAAMAEFRREQQEQEQAARRAEQQRDFVQGAVDEAGARGQGSRVDTVAAQIERKLADYRRRFDEDMGAPEKQRITEALTAADARETADRFNTAYVEPLERLRALQGKVGVDREVLNAQLEETARLGRELTPVEKAQIENGIRQGDQLQRQAQLLQEVLAPLKDYQDRIAALNALLAAGTITQTQYNARISELGQAARQSIAEIPGNDPATGQSYADLAARDEETARYQRELADFENNRAQLLKMGLNYNALIEASHRNHVQRMNAIDQSRRQVALTAAQSTADSLLQIAEVSMGRQSAVYKAMFVVSKAFAIADSIIQIQGAIAKALNAPFPENLVQVGIVAAAAASIVSNIAAVKLNLADGGYISGPGGGRDDRIPVNASNGEFMVNADATARNRPLLEAINNGTLIAHSRRANNDNAAAAAGGAGGNSYSFSFGDVVVKTGGGVGPEDGRMIGRDVKAAIGQIVEEKIKQASRSGGQLTRVRPSVMAG